MRTPLMTLLALAACWPIWLAAGWTVDRLSPGGGELLLRAGLLFLALGLLGRFLDRLDDRRTHE
jgi:hypothetical protein